MPQTIVSDRDPKFLSGFWTSLFNSLGTKLKMTTAYRAQGDGQTERMNRTLEEYLRAFVGPNQSNWDQHLANAEFVINSTVNSSIKMTPFEVDLGYTPNNPLSNFHASQLGIFKKKEKHGKEFALHQKAILKRCQGSIAKAQQTMCDQYNNGRYEQHFNIGDLVYLSTKNLDPDHAGIPGSSKFAPKWIGPYKIIRKVHRQAYQLNLPNTCRLHDVFNTGALKPFVEKARLSKPSSVILQDGSIGQIVSKISNTRKRRGKMEFEVHWEGEDTPTWEPYENLALQCKGLIDDFEKQAKQRKRKKQH